MRGRQVKERGFCSSGLRHYAICLSLTSAVRTPQRQRYPSAHQNHLSGVVPDAKVGAATMYRAERNFAQLMKGASNV